uniref:Large ribosomal subunit protein uL1c n=1 Tax=Poteriospumella lacustris TaxID=1117027 RepID=A0A7S6TCJ1_9STRA|nr:ribosomal protein L1 [Poteriospumella lacustris]
MKKLSKRLIILKSLIKKDAYSISDAIALVKNFQTAKFSESVEAHISLNLNPKYPNQQLRASFILPNGTGKELKIAALTQNEDVQSALDFGATIAGFENLLDDISKGIINFDVLITTPQLMPKLAKFGKILGPKSLMPSPKAGTVTTNLKETIQEFKKGKIEYRCDKTGIVHLIFGKTSFSQEFLEENLKAIYDSIEKNKPSNLKGKYFDSFHICTTMSPSIRLDLTSFKQ